MSVDRDATPKDKAAGTAHYKTTVTYGTPPSTQTDTPRFSLEIPPLGSIESHVGVAIAGWKRELSSAAADHISHHDIQALRVRVVALVAEAITNARETAEMKAGKQPPDRDQEPTSPKRREDAGPHRQAASPGPTDSGAPTGGTLPTSLEISRTFAETP